MKPIAGADTIPSGVGRTNTASTAPRRTTEAGSMTACVQQFVVDEDRVRVRQRSTSTVASIVSSRCCRDTVGSSRTMSASARRDHDDPRRSSYQRPRPVRGVRRGSRRGRRRGGDSRSRSASSPTRSPTTSTSPSRRPALPSRSDGAPPPSRRRSAAGCPCQPSAPARASARSPVAAPSSTTTWSRRPGRCRR